MELLGSFTFVAIDGAEVRLKSGSSRLMNVEIKAPVRSGSLHIVDSIATMNLVLALDKLKTGNFLTEAAARTFISGYKAQDLVFKGSGPHSGNSDGSASGSASGSAYDVSGNAVAGEIDVQMSIILTSVGNSAQPEVELKGSAQFGTVHIPLPGIGTVENMNIEIDARLAIRQS
jgi:hypothetical protein